MENPTYLEYEIIENFLKKVSGNYTLDEILKKFNSINQNKIKIILSYLIHEKKIGIDNNKKVQYIPEVKSGVHYVL
jgi:hypothetical protein